LRAVRPSAHLHKMSEIPARLLAYNLEMIKIKVTFLLLTLHVYLRTYLLNSSSMSDPSNFITTEALKGLTSLFHDFSLDVILLARLVASPPYQCQCQCQCTWSQVIGGAHS